jgi:hypothetical protein
MFLIDASGVLSNTTKARAVWRVMGRMALLGETRRDRRDRVILNSRTLIGRYKE